MISRRELLRGLLAGTATAISRIALADVKKTPSPEYVNILYDKPAWTTAGKGIDFTRIEIRRNQELIEVAAIMKIDPKYNQIRVFSSYEEEGKATARTIEEWQKVTGALGMVNGAQYMADPYYMPCAPIICDGKPKGPKSNPSVRGMLVAEPKRPGLPIADLLDFEFDQYHPGSYTQGVQHWPILLDRHGNIKVKKSGWQANRTIVAKDSKGNILFLTTEGSYFTLYNLGFFLKESNAKPHGGLHIHTAMNLDGGGEANMVLKTKKVAYLRHGSFEESRKDTLSLLQFKRKIPGVIGVFSR